MNDDVREEVPEEPSPGTKPLKIRLETLKTGTQREKDFKELSMSLGALFGCFVEWLALNGLPVPGAISQQIEGYSQKAHVALEKLERGAVIYRPRI